MTKLDRLRKSRGTYREREVHHVLYSLCVISCLDIHGSTSVLATTCGPVVDVFIPHSADPALSVLTVTEVHSVPKQFNMSQCPIFLKVLDKCVRMCLPHIAQEILMIPCHYTSAALLKSLNLSTYSSASQKMTWQTLFLLSSD